MERSLEGGFPVGAFMAEKGDNVNGIAGKSLLIRAGTLSGNPLAMTAGIETLRILFNKRHIQKLESLQRLKEGLRMQQKGRGCHSSTGR